MLSEAKVTEINLFFQDRMAQKKKIWAGRGKDAQIAAAAKRALAAPTWRQMSGLRLLAHEAGHVGNRPFMVGFAVTAVGALWIQTKFTDQMKADSVYWSTFHGAPGAKGAH